MKKKVIISFIVIILIISIGCFYYFNLKKDYEQNNNENLNDIENNQEIDLEEQNNIDNQKVIDDAGDIRSVVSEEYPSNNNSETNNQEETKQDFSTPATNTTDFNTTNDSTSNPTSKIEISSEVIPTCTPKKFDLAFARADFESMEACQSKGNQYKEHDYGYICDYFPDDCGTYYYMLTLFDSNGNHYDYHDVKIPE